MNEKQAALSDFRIGPTDEEAKTGGRRLPNGLIKTGHGSLVIDPDNVRMLRHQRPSDAPEPVYEDAVEELPKAASRSLRKKKAEPAKPQSVQVRLIVPGVGEIPTQYRHVYRGRGVMVLGLSQASFVPKQASRDGDSIVGEVVFAEWPNDRYVYTGMEFRDSSGVRSLILIKLPDNEPEEEEVEEDDDEEGEQ